MKTKALAAAAAAIAGLRIGTLCGVDRQPLWPEGRNPGADGGRPACLEWTKPPSKPNGVCMILVSGGGREYAGLVREWSERFTSIGCQCVELATDEWADGQRAVRLVRYNAEKRGVIFDRIGVASAGMRLATLLATSSTAPAYRPVDHIDADVPCNVDWAIAGAADCDPDGAPGPAAFRFDARTAPMCMLYDTDDNHSPLPLTRTYRRLKYMKVPAELHFSTGRSQEYWFGRVREFMAQMGYLGPLGGKVPLVKRFADDDARGGCERESIWPDGGTPDVQTNQCVPYIEWHMPKEPKTKAVMIVYSGGAYNANKPDGNEVAPFRRYLNAKGMAAVTLKYRTPRPAPPLERYATAWQDLQRAIRVVRSKAASKGLDPGRIGIMGSSAGGHLTLLGATSSRQRSYGPIDGIDEVPCNVQLAVSVYPGYVFEGHKMQTREQGEGGNELPLSPEFKFDRDTPPVIFLHGDADVWSPIGSVKCWERLLSMGIKGELHTYALRPHCFHASSSPGTGAYAYMDRIWEFMAGNGFGR